MAKLKIMKLLPLIALLGACSFSGDKHEDIIAGKVTDVDASEEMVWIDAMPLYVDDPSVYSVGDIVRITFTDPSLEDSWNPDEFKVIDVEFLDKGLYSKLRNIAWSYLSKEIEETIITSKDSAEVKDGTSNANNPYTELESETMDNRRAWLVYYFVAGNMQPYKVIIDQESLEVLGITRPEN